MNRAVNFVDEQVTKVQKHSQFAASTRWSGRVTKRLMDILGALVGFLLLWPVFVFVAVLIKRESPGPVFFHGERVGRFGKVFKILKFRTMYESPENHTGLRLTVKHDSRVTPFGGWLRETKLNELPQFWNVLVGDMSLVGPRPEDPVFVAEWPEDVRAEILSVRPGMTSPASVTYRDEEKLLSGSSVLDDYLRSILPEKMRLDQLYVRHHSLVGDLDVILTTMVILIPALRSRKISENILFRGPFSRFTRNIFSWFIVDAFVAFFGISLATLIWRIQAVIDVGFGRMVLIAVGLAFGLAVMNIIFGLNRVEWQYASPTHVFDLAVSTTLAMLLFAMLWILFPVLVLPVNLMIYFGIFSFVGFVVARYRERLITGFASRWIRWRSQSSVMGERVLVVGAGDAAQLAIWLLEKSNLFSAFSIIGMVDDDFRKVNQRINGYTVLGTTRDIPEIVTTKSVGLIMFAISNLDKKDRDRILALCSDLPARVLLIPDLLKVVSNYFTRQTREVGQPNE